MLDVKIGMCIFQTLHSDWLLCVTGSVEHAPMLRLVMLHVPKCRQAVLKAVPDRGYCSDSTLAENKRGSERGRGESERETEGEGEREISPRAPGPHLHDGIRSRAAAPLSVDYINAGPGLQRNV